MLMGVYASRAMLRSVSRFKCLRKPWLFGADKVKNDNTVEGGAENV